MCEGGRGEASIHAPGATERECVLMVNDSMSFFFLSIYRLVWGLFLFFDFYYFLFHFLNSGGGFIFILFGDHTGN